MKIECLMLFLSTCVITALMNTEVHSQNINNELDIRQQFEIQPYKKNPWYWEFNGKPILLRGGTDDDNLFQWTGVKLTDHLDLLKSVGGNYVRNTMSDRDSGNVYAHTPDATGKYDLEVWNEEYWSRLEIFLIETSKREIVVQLTLWDIYDLDNSGFPSHPLNPSNNINWESGLIKKYEDYYGGSLTKDIQPVLRYQQKYIDKLVSVTFGFGNVLYNINNESLTGSEWEKYWAHYILQKANEINKEIHVTSMQMEPNGSVRHVMTNRNLYSFAEISQNNQDSRGGRGLAHYKNIMYWRRMIEVDVQGPMPMNNEKIYGTYSGKVHNMGTGQEAEDRFWKNVFAGAASVRFHRPGAGLGLSTPAQSNIKSMQVFLSEFDLFNASPYEGIKMYGASEGYALGNIGKQYAIYLPIGRYGVEFDPWIYVKKVKLKYLDIETSTWTHEEVIDMNWEDDLSLLFGHQKGIIITSPGTRACVVVVKVVN